MELRDPWNSLVNRTMASFKGGEHSNDPRRCTAQSSQTGKRCKNASIPGGRVCRYHVGAAPQVVKRAQERIRELEHPALDALTKLLDPKRSSVMRRAWPQRRTSSIGAATKHPNRWK